MSAIKIASLAIMAVIWFVMLGRGLLHLRFGSSEYIERRLELAGYPEWVLWIARRRRQIDSMIALWCAVGVVAASVGLIVSTRAW